MTPTVLILGGTGMLGHSMLQVLARDFDVHATARDVEAFQRYDLPGTAHYLDATEPERLAVVLSEVEPVVVVNCIGLVKQLKDASSPIDFVQLNSLFPHHAAKVCNEKGARFIHISTDCVFSGNLAAPNRYLESDLADARDLYGLSKLLGETMSDGALTIRTSIIGWELSRATGLLEWFASQRGRDVAGFTNAIFSGFTTLAFSEIVREIIANYPRLSGLRHVSADSITKYELLTMLNDTFDFDCTINPVNDPHINRALDSTCFRKETAINIPSWGAMISAYADYSRHAVLAR